MATDRSIRLLSALSTASTSRVLNLSAIAAANVDNPEHRARPLFKSPVINASIILKHRIRSDEGYMFADNRPVATKIIVPFDVKDLKSGGRSFFVDQRGFQESLRDIGNYADDQIEHDIEIFRVLNTLPSLDPFLLREHLRANEIECADCYFAISQADQRQMFNYVATEVRKLINLATGNSRGNQGSTARLVGALLSSEVDEKLEPLRETLGMSPPDFREGVFSWRGFLYYKWCMEKLWPELIGALKEVRAVQPVGALDQERKAFLLSSQNFIIERVRDNGQSVRSILSVYDAAYNDLVKHETPKTFRDFLLSAPHLFLDLGEKVGAMSHIASFWRYRFPRTSASTRSSVDADELANIFTDFNSSFGQSAAVSQFDY